MPAGRCGIRPGVKEHLLAIAPLTDGDRAALQGLIPLAGAVGAGTIFSLFASGRRDTGFRVFEIFAIVAVLTAAALTATLCIDQLHANEAITDRELTETAMPLVIAVLLLVLISVFERIEGPWGRVATLTLAAVGAIFAAAETTISSWSVSPGSALGVVLAIFAAGLVLSRLTSVVDRYRLRLARQEEQARVTRLVGLGYAPSRIALVPALPRVAKEGPGLGGWTRGGVTLLDHDDAERLRDLVRDRWDALAAGEASPAVGDLLLLDVDLEHRARRGTGPGALRIKLLRPGTKDPEETIEIAAGEHRLFDVSDLVL